METKNLTTIEVNQLIAERASENEEFRLALLSDPKAALEKEFSVTFPEQTKVEVHVESTKELHLIIPAGNIDELSDDQLEDVAGGINNTGSLSPICAYGVPSPLGPSWRWPSI